MGETPSGRLKPAALPTDNVSMDHGGIVLGWLTRLVVVMSVIGLVLFDAISVASTSATVADQGSYAAREASAVWDATHNVQRAYDKAAATAAEANSLNRVATTGFQIDPDGTVHLVIQREATTILLYRWDRTEAWTRIRREAHGRSVAS